jgi:Mg2+/Co2+ transporter CorB
MEAALSEFQIIIFSIILVLLVLCSAFFSMSETSFMAVNRYRLRHKARMRRRSAIRLLQMLRRPDRLLGAILIGNTFANMLASALATLIAVHYFGEKGAFISAIVMTVLVLIFAEITPKTLAALYSDSVARWLTYPVYYMMRLFHPMVVAANAVSNTLLRVLFRIRVTSYSVEPLSREELRTVVYDTTGKISRQYQNMLLGILDLSNLTVDDVMIPSHEISAIDIEQPWKKIKNQLEQFKREAVPFYRENVNQVVGVLYARDMKHLFLGGVHFDKDVLLKTLREPYFIPEGTPLNVQLDYFQQNKGKPAFVVDEYGEILGLLTMTDILEEVVGDFTSSMSSGKRAEKQQDGSYLVDGANLVREFNRMTGWMLPLRGPRTINGLIIEYLEALPSAGTTVLISDHPIEVIKVKDNRVKLARIFPRLAVPGAN